MPEQVALAEFIARGELDRHLRRTRPLYRRRRDVLVAALADAFPGAPIGGAAAGLHLVLPLAGRGGEVVLEAACAELGVRVVGLTAHHARPDGAPRGLVLGFGGIRTERIAAGVARLAEAVAATRTS